MAAVAAASAAWPLIATGLDRAPLDAAQFRPLLLNLYGIYQVALSAWIVLCMIVFAAIWRISVAETFQALRSPIHLRMEPLLNAADAGAVVPPLTASAA